MQSQKLVIFKKLNQINNLWKYSLLTIIFIIITFLFLCIDSTGFISPNTMIKSWNDNYFSNGIKVSFIAFIVFSIIVGFSSTSSQNINKNNIATPGTLGIGAATTFGYLLARATNVYSNYFVILITFLAGIVPILLNAIISIYFKNQKAIKLILVGLATTAIFGSINYIIRDSIGLSRSSLVILSRIHGSLTWSRLYWAIPLTCIGILLIIIYSKKINVIQYSDYVAEKQSINIIKTRIIVSLAILILVTSGVFIIGNLMFLGIIGANTCRILFKNNKTILISCSSSMFIFIVIFFSKIVYAYLNIDINITIAIIGIPVFFISILKEKKWKN